MQNKMICCLDGIHQESKQMVVPLHFVWVPYSENFTVLSLWFFDKDFISDQTECLI